MQDLRVNGVEDGALLLTTDAGDEYRLPVTHSLRAQLRTASGETPATTRKAPPREIQSLVRSGLTSAEVAALTGADVEFVHRFEGPVLAERAFVLETALRVAVSVATEVAPATGSGTFGAVIESRLDAAEATDREWTSYKDGEHGWVVRVSYTTQEVQREAVWRFDPKRTALAPHSGDAHALSRHSADPGPLVPRLRAVSPSATDDESGSRFDSGAFEVDLDRSGADPEPPAAAPAVERPRLDPRSAASMAATNREPHESSPSSHAQTADLLEALRRRRGERESARFTDDERAGHPSTGSMRVIDVPLTDFSLPEGAPAPEADEPEQPAPPSQIEPRAIGSARRGRGRESLPTSATTAPPKKGRGRASMPSWDEIVFGARSDDEGPA
jgi:hypothetical protein